MSTTETSVTSKLLIVGGPSSGKTTYRTQLYQRVEHQDGELQLVKSVGDMGGLDNDVERLVQGLQPMHTNLDTYHTNGFVVKDKTDRQFLLEFADYGGEQVLRIGETNLMPALWLERAQQSSRWLLFLKIDPIRSLKSFMTDPVHSGPLPEANGDTPSPERSAELIAIETLQRLLFVQGASLHHPLNSPRLGIFLSCWDELPETERTQPPSAILEQRAPLFSRFLAANWHPDQCRIWGLSSTEGKLSEEIPNVEFARKGPEHVGYIVLKDGKPSPDLTLPISWLMRGE